MPLSFPLSQGPLMGTLSESEIDTNVTDPNEMGIVQMRATTTRTYRTFSMTYFVTEAERITLLDFYDTDLGRVDSFLWTHPASSEVITVHLKRRPQIQENGSLNYNAAVELQEV